MPFRSFAAPDPTGLLQLFDGTSLHGNLESISTDNGIAWAFPATDKPIVFKPDNISQIRFENTLIGNGVGKPTCRFRFHNGDEILGDLVGIEGAVATIQSWFGGQLKAPTESFSALQFSARGFKVLYEGPNGPGEWKAVRSGTAWTYKDCPFPA